MRRSISAASGTPIPTYLDCPPMATMLIALEVPPFGGDTLFANQHLAYEALSEGMRRCSTRCGR